MKKIVDYTKQYIGVISIVLALCILLTYSLSYFKVNIDNKRAAEMYIGDLKYTISIDGASTNTLTVPSGETIVDVTITNENPIDTYYKLIYQNNSNISIKYYESTKDTNDKVTNYSSPNSKIISNNKNTIKLKITNSSTSSQKVTFKIVGGFATNTLEDVTAPSGYTTINTIEIPSTNTYFCTTTDALAQGLQYVNGQYTYAYKQEGVYGYLGLGWNNISNNGWGVQLTNKTSTDAVTSKICTYINNKPIASMSYMFSNSQATTLDVSSFDTSNVTDMSDMFNISQATTLDLSNFNTSNVTNMYNMFGYSKATTLDLSNFDTKNVTDMSYMFVNSQATTLDLSNFDTSNVTNMNYMFAGSQAATLDLSNFNTSNVTNMGQMFANSKATTLDLSNFNTSNVTDMMSMFSGSQATTLDLSNFDTSNVTDMSYMFNNVKNLKTIYASDKFNANKTYSADMFTGSTKLVGGAGTKYDSTKIDKAYAHIDGGTSNPGYFTDIADKDISSPVSFSTDSWKTIINAVRKNNISKYNIGDVKEVDLGTYGKHNVRIANTTTPTACSTSGFSQTACGFVLEFADIITYHKMNDTDTNVGGWLATSMRTFVNNDIYNAIPSELKNAIIDTTVVSGHGSTSGETNFTSTDKLYLLAPKEIYTNFSSSYDTAKDLTRTLDYYTSIGITTSNYSEAIKKNGISASIWWLRAATSSSTYSFLSVYDNGGWANEPASISRGVAPAFRLG